MFEITCRKSRSRPAASRPNATALGGVVSAVTKSGSNTFRGEGHYYFGGNPLAFRPGQAPGARPEHRGLRLLHPDEKSPLKINEFGGSLGE
ncbi:MAG: hypothetical protein R2708_25045 [Vicinamibacterales bacterium]